MNKNGKENKNFPATASIAAKATDNITANLFKNCAIFLVLVLANQFKNK